MNGFHLLCVAAFGAGLRCTSAKLNLFRLSRVSFVAVENGRIVGTVSVSDTSYDPIYARITNVAVAEDLRGRGIVGPGLLRVAEGWALNNGYVGCTLQAYPNRLGFYERNGYSSSVSGVNFVQTRLILFRKTFPPLATVGGGIRP